MDEDQLNQETFKCILSDAYKRGNEVENIKVLVLIEEIKKQIISAQKSWK
ncbi:hypothetical protein [Peribacillus glennii]|nr:hypothetical protein [Peribacillus glennii]